MLLIRPRQIRDFILGMLSVSNVFCLVWLLFSSSLKVKPRPTPLDPVPIDSGTTELPECRVPLPPLMEGQTRSTLEEAFAASWRERCKLDHERFTVLMTSDNGRIDIVRKNLALFASGRVKSVAAVYLRWFGDEPLRPGLFNPRSAKIPVHVYHNLNNSLINRWQPIPDLTTAYVFSHDDDMLIAPDDLEWGWQMSKMHRPAFTSFVGRTWIMDAKSGQPQYRVGNEGDDYRMGTSASWIHSSFMDAWSHPFMGPIHRIVEATQNCEDIAMAFLIPYLIRTPALVVVPKHDIVHYQFSGRMVSGQSDHWEKRNFCSAAFLDLFGAMPPSRDYSIQRGLSAGKRKIKYKQV